MKGPIGHTFMYNIIILFIFIVFAFIGGILSYYKGYKINNRIVGSIEKFGGEEYSYCIYSSYNPSDKNSIPKGGGYYQYGVLTYMNVNLPLIKEFSIPIFTRTNRIYKFSWKS